MNRNALFFMAVVMAFLLYFCRKKPSWISTDNLTPDDPVQRQHWEAHQTAMPFIRAPETITGDVELDQVCNHAKYCRECRGKLQKYLGTKKPVPGPFGKVQQPHLNADEMWAVISGIRAHTPAKDRLLHLAICNRCNKSLRKTR